MGVVVVKKKKGFTNILQGSFEVVMDTETKNLLSQNYTYSLCHIPTRGWLLMDTHMMKLEYVKI